MQQFLDDLPVYPINLETGNTISAKIAAKLNYTREQRFEQVRDAVVNMGCFDLLASHVLQYRPESHHLEMMQFQDTFREGMILGWRGAAKTTYCTITRAIGEILCNPNIRILFACDAAEQAKTFLREVKSHFERNELLKSVFGDYVTNAPKWADSEIIVNRRSSHAKEATITCAGTDTTLPGRHFDLILADDLVSEDNSQTKGQRDKVHDWFYRTLMPTMAMPYGRMYVIGTRWHEEDLYGWLLKEDYKDAHLIIPVLDADERSIWEDMFPTDRMHRIRKGNLSAFELQYMCTSGTAIGGIFTPDHFETYEELPHDVFWWQGVDLAVTQKQTADLFAHCTVAIHKETKQPYLIDYRAMRIPFPKQIPFIAKKFEEHPSTIRVVIESNAYQLAASQQIRYQYPHIPVYPKHTATDKIARANQLAGILGEKGIHIKRGHHGFLRHFCALRPIRGDLSKPNDLFDAFYLAVMQGLRGARKKRREEPGLI